MKKTPNKKLNDIIIRTNISIAIIIILLSTVMAISYITYSSWMNPINEKVQIVVTLIIAAILISLLYGLIHNLEGQVEERKNQLQLILDSTVEGIYGMDLNGNCTFINASGLRILGYEDELELIGKNMHLEIHHSDVNGVPIPHEECGVLQTLAQNKGFQVDNQVFWKKDGTFFSVEYFSYPQLMNGEIVGVVVTFVNNTEKKEKMQRIEYLSMYDELTGLYNRWYMKDAMIRLDTKRNLPFTLMVIDVNGLKLVNDAFGHEMGDQLLKVVSKVLKSVLRTEDIVGRVGGDEFLILLPKTDKIQAEYIKKRIIKAASLEKLDPVIVSVAIGYTVKETETENIENILIAADNQMYKNKLVYGKTMRNQTIERIIRNINLKYDQEKIHTERVSQYCESIGEAMGFSQREIESIKTIGILHDLGKVAVPSDILNKAEKATNEELKLIRKHPETGYHILKSVDEYTAFAEDVLCHHENWDGTGYPQGLKGNEIPLNSRIIAVADAYESMTAKRAYQKTKTKAEAIAELKKCAGTQFDPEIVTVFVEKVLQYIEDKDRED